jgi:hypothetical protein
MPSHQLEESFTPAIGVQLLWSGFYRIFHPKK